LTSALGGIGYTVGDVSWLETHPVVGVIAVDTGRTAGGARVNQAICDICDVAGVANESVAVGTSDALGVELVRGTVLDGDLVTGAVHVCELGYALETDGLGRICPAAGDRVALTEDYADAVGHVVVTGAVALLAEGDVGVDAAADDSVGVLDAAELVGAEEKADYATVASVNGRFIVFTVENRIV